MRGSNAWQITAIIAIILVVVLLIPLILLIKDRQVLADGEKAAKEAQTAAARDAAKWEGDLKTLKGQVGVPETTTLEELTEQYNKLMDRLLPGENEAIRTYQGAIDMLDGNLGKERIAHSDTQSARAQLQSDYNNTLTSHKGVIDQKDRELDRVKGERDADRRQFTAMKERLDADLKKALEQQQVTLTESEMVQSKLEKQAKLLALNNADILNKNNTLTDTLTEIRNPNLEHPAGKIISVDQRAGTAIVNIGEVDGLGVRTMFSVYHSSITGISFRSTPVNSEVIYCDICMREIARHVTKASVEVTKILGPHRAEVRILDDILTDPIMVGDVVYSPIWKPGQRVRFALTAGMHLPGSGIDSGTDAIKRLIEMNGGIVDCWINENATEGEEPFKGEISDFTNFIVVNEKIARNLEPEIARVQQELLESAKNRAIKAISLEDLLSRMGYRNVTPVYNSGSPTFLPEMRVIPQHQGALHESSGVVSPAFTPENAAARLNPRDATPVRTSPGIVSPYFDSNAPPPPAGSGRASELFRPRSPSGGN